LGLVLEDLFLNKTETTPEISFSADGNLSVKGRSIPENAKEFYDPVFAWLEKFSQSGVDKCNIEIGLDYFNSISQKMILRFFIILEELQKNDCKVNVTWCYEEFDYDMEDEGEVFKSKSNLDFELKEVPSL
jgi:hypothetical protein